MHHRNLPSLSRSGRTRLHGERGLKRPRCPRVQVKLPRTKLPGTTSLQKQSLHPFLKYFARLMVRYPCTFRPHITNYSTDHRFTETIAGCQSSRAEREPQCCRHYVR
ncbi:hypothetical protein Mapa_017170 [Marchantia paleacea]|nr:hypothetical protein Mapa_017170 [Marchantia paleacea]